MGIKYTMVTSYLFIFTLKMADLILSTLLHYFFIAFHPQLFDQKIKKKKEANTRVIYFSPVSYSCDQEIVEYSF